MGSIETCTNRLQGTGHQLFQFVQAAIDACAPLALQHRLHHLPVLVGPGHGLSGHVVGLHHVRVQVWCHNKSHEDRERELHRLNDPRHGGRRSLIRWWW